MEPESWQTYLGMVQSRSIVCSVTGYGNYGPFLLEQLNQSLLGHRAGTAKSRAEESEAAK